MCTSALFAFPVFAGGIDEATAQQVAIQKLQSSRAQSGNQLKSGSTMQLLYKSSTESDGLQLKSGETTTYFYVFGEESGGFVIVSGDNRVTPVLGYSDTNRFSADNMPPNLQWWLGEYAKQIQFAIENEIEPTAEVQQQWEELLNE